MKEQDTAVIIRQFKDLITSGDYDFDQIAMNIFQFQSRNNMIYHTYLDLINCYPEQVTRLEEIPFLPVQLFKFRAIQTGKWKSEAWFESSGTTGQQPSRHMVEDLSFYHRNCVRGFQNYWGDPAEWCILALLPSYLERHHSSLVSMVDYFIRRSTYQESGFYLYDHQKLYDQLMHCQSKGIPTVLFGVAFALTDFFEKYKMNFPGLHVIETGGMKGRREEMTREALHEFLRQRSQAQIHSEYGMTELLSQGYATGDLIFANSSTFRARLFEREDPLVPENREGRVGRIGVIDLANVATCSFILTEDLGRYRQGGFTVEGRLDASEWRGCNLMVQDL